MKPLISQLTEPGATYTFPGLNSQILFEKANEVGQQVLPMLPTPVCGNMVFSGIEVEFGLPAQAPKGVPEEHRLPVRSGCVIFACCQENRALNIGSELIRTISEILLRVRPGADPHAVLASTLKGFLLSPPAAISRTQIVDSHQGYPGPKLVRPSAHRGRCVGSVGMT